MEVNIYVKILFRQDSFQIRALMTTDTSETSSVDKKFPELLKVSRGFRPILRPWPFLQTILMFSEYLHPNIYDSELKSIIKKVLMWVFGSFIPVSVHLLHLFIPKVKNSQNEQSLTTEKIDQSNKTTLRESWEKNKSGVYEQWAYKRGALFQNIAPFSA